MKLRDSLMFIAIIAITNAEYKEYKNHKVYKIVPQTSHDVKVLSELQKDKKLNFWTDTIKIDGDVRIMVAPENEMELEEYLAGVDISFEVVIQDVQKMINDQLRRPKHNSRSITEYAWDYYQTLDEINAWMEAIVAEHSDVATLVVIGASVENREIKGVKIDYKKQENATIAMIEGGIHAREWIAHATVTWIIKEFLTSTDPNIRALAENIVWHIFPVVNPDGYVYTFTDNRMWRKNRNTAYNTSCGPNMNDDFSNGVDLNRNFGHVWMSIGASQDPCTEIYAGPIPFSEPETLAITNYVLSLQQQGNLLMYFAFHSFSQMVLIPHSHYGGIQVLQTPNYADMFEISVKGMDKLKEKHGISYIVGTSDDILYPASGGSFDWVKGGANVPLVYLFELRDVGQFGFLLPTEQIVPNNEEVMAGLVEMDRVTRNLGYYRYRSSGSRFGLSAVVFVLAITLSLKF